MDRPPNRLVSRTKITGRLPNRPASQVRSTDYPPNHHRVSQVRSTGRLLNRPASQVRSTDYPPNHHRVSQVRSTDHLPNRPIRKRVAAVTKVAVKERTSRCFSLDSMGCCNLHATFTL